MKKSFSKRIIDVIDSTEVFYPIRWPESYTRAWQTDFRQVDKEMGDDGIIVPRRIVVLIKDDRIRQEEVRINVETEKGWGVYRVYSVSAFENILGKFGIWSSTPKYGFRHESFVEESVAEPQSPEFEMIPPYKGCSSCGAKTLKKCRCLI